MEEHTNHCMECGKTNVVPHHYFKPVNGACLCDGCGKAWEGSPACSLKDAVAYYVRRRAGATT